MNKIRGDYFDPEDEKKNLEKYYALQEFWSSTETYAPKTLVSLKEEVLPVYNRLFPKDYSSVFGTLNLKRLRWHKIEAVNLICSDSLIPLIGIINEWSKKFNLIDEWIKDKVLITLADWRESPPEKELFWYGVDANVFVNKPKFFSFTAKGWNPIVETWGKAKQRITSKLEHCLENNHRKEIESFAKESGLVKSQHKRRTEKHMYWLIEYQIHKKSYGQIYREDKEGSKQKKERLIQKKECKVINAIINTAELIGLTLRKKIHSNK